MNTFLCILKADIRRFWSMCWKFYMVFYIYCVFQAVSYFSNVYRCIKNSRISSISLGDSLLYVFRGAKEFSPGMQIDIPLFEILIVLYITFIITYYITTDQKACRKEYSCYLRFSFRLVAQQIYHYVTGCNYIYGRYICC